ncbi:MAG: EthD family reductase [Actinomycetales bacterium]
MAKIIFVHYRKEGITREEMTAAWSDDTQLSIISRLPGLTKWLQNHVVSPGDDASNDGIGELWFESDEALEEAINSDVWKEAVEDARRYIDLERSGAIIVKEKMMIER